MYEMLYITDDPSTVNYTTDIEELNTIYNLVLKPNNDFKKP